MASGAELSPRITALAEGRCRDDSACGLGNGTSHSFSSTDHGYTGKPPRNLPIIRQCVSSARLPVLEHDTHTGKSGGDVEFIPVLRSGSCSEIGPKRSMEDEFICINDLRAYAGESSGIPSPAAFYGVFDGHGGVDVASFTKKNLLGFILRDTHFNHGVENAVRCAFFEADKAIADTTSIDSSSGTTVLTALILNRTMYVANAGDSRAVLGKRGRAVELSNDHKPNCTSERVRIEKLGGMVYDGYLEGQLSVARALGDWHLKGPKGSKCPLIPEPEVQEVVLTDEDEFLILGCDGLWDVMSSQCAVTIVRKELMTHNDPDMSSKELVKEALKRNTCDNLTVVVICFSSHPPPPLEIPRPHRRRSISAEALDLLKGVLNNN